MQFKSKMKKGMRGRPWLAFRFLLFFIFGTLIVSGSSSSQTVTFAGSDVPLKKVFSVIKQQTGYVFFYDEYLLKQAKPVTINAKNEPVEKVLNQVFSNQPLTWVIEDKTVTILKKTVKSAIVAQPVTLTEVVAIDVSGKVTDEDGHPLEQVSVVQKGSTRGTSTNEDGEYELNGVDEDAVLEFSIVGFASQSVAVKNRGVINITLKRNIQEEQAIVVSTGYQTIPKERATGSFSVVTPKDMDGKLQTNIMDRVEGLVSGLTSYKGNINIRGISTLQGVKSPLIVVDGVPFEGSLSAINPADIESLTVLKDATAASIYGARSANGVIVINTKSGKAGPLRVNYDATLKVTPLPKRSYANKMSSAELVDFQKEMFGYRSGSYSAIDPRKAMNDVYRLLYEEREGNITAAELETALDVYRSSDRYDQVVDEFLKKTSLLQQHNISFSGGSDIYKYHLSGNYLGSNPYERAQSTQQVGFNLKNTFNFTKWLNVDLGVLGTSNKSDYANGYSGMNILNAGKASYYMLRDNEGNIDDWYLSKSQFEIDRLKSLGLLDETFSPITELNKQHFTRSDNYININLGARVNIFDGLTLDLRYQKERTELYSKQLYDQSSNRVKTQMNDATVIDRATGKIIQYMPVGGQVSENRGDRNSHTLRAQLNYNKRFGSLHRVDVIAGGEQRKIVNSNTNVYKYGYDDYSLNYKPIDELALSQTIYGTEALFGQFRLNKAETGFTYGDDRYVAFYGNGSYTYNSKITATGSIRMDQSNLFGTDPKYQYKPLWSAGLLYVIRDFESGWLNRLAVRGTYGINGNIPKVGGPYMISKSDGNNYYTNETQDYVSSPPNSGLRWEKTKVTNLALDFDMLENRLTGSLEVYNKSTSDLLGTLLSDPTIGWNSVLVNYGSMNNKGVELSLNHQNIRTKELQWNTILNFSYNKNKLTRLENSDNTVYTYVSSGQNRVGVPMNAIYSIRYGGLDKEGRPIGLTKKGEEVKGTDQLTIDDLIYEGTATPPFAASLQNSIRYKGFDLYFMFIYYGGHVMRDVMAPYLTKYPELNYTTNMDRQALNYWKKPGDELIPGIAPAFYDGVGYTKTQLWEAGNQHIQKADFIKLRDVSLSYNLANDFLKSKYIQRVRLSLQVQNLWRWSANKQNLDPEVWEGTTLTPTRGNLIPPTYTFGLSVTF